LNIAEVLGQQTAFVGMVLIMAALNILMSNMRVVQAFLVLEGACEVLNITGR
jgi:hypothetical protein